MKSGANANDYGARASRDLIVTRGAGFRKEKNKKKRGVSSIRHGWALLIRPVVRAMRVARSPWNHTASNSTISAQSFDCRSWPKDCSYIHTIIIMHMPLHAMGGLQ